MKNGVEVLILEGVCEDCGEGYSTYLVVANGQAFTYASSECPRILSKKKPLSKKDAQKLLLGVKKDNAKKISDLQKEINSVNKMLMIIL